MLGLLFRSDLCSDRSTSAEIGDFLIENAACRFKTAQVRLVLAIDHGILAQLARHLAAEAAGIRQCVCLPDGADEAFEAAFVVAWCEFGELDVVGTLGRGGGVFVEGSTELADRLAFLEEGAALL